ncbi:MAG: type 1 glutamine amidotransferase [Bdellovibrionota bacterium]
MAPKPVYVFQHVEHEGLGLIENALTRAGKEIRFFRGFAGEAIPASTKGACGIIVMGGPMNADETRRYPFLGAERKLLEAALKEDVPVLGVCLGSQMLARALGARVYRAKRPEIGLFRVDWTDAARGSDPLFRHYPAWTEVFQWHGDTFDLPQGAVHLARSEVCENQAFRYGKAWGLQFHLEITPAMVLDWLGVARGDLCHNPGVDVARLLREGRESFRFTPIAERARESFGAWAGLLQ